MALPARDLTKLADWLAAADRILLLTHRYPDGDGLGSVLALHTTLNRLGKLTTCVAPSPVPLAFHFLPGVEAFQMDFLGGDYDLIVTCDCGDVRRTGFDGRLRRFARSRRRLVNLDHHPKNDLGRLANLNLSSQTVSATAELIYELHRAYGWPIDHEVATALLTGLHTDTGGFKHPNTTPAILRIAADLMSCGGRLGEITRHLSHRRSVATLRLWGVVLERLQCHHNLGIVSSLVTLDDLHDCAADHADVAGVVNLMKTIPSAKLAILFTEQTDGSMKASVRGSGATVNVARLAALFGGGGLKRAGGFSIPGRMIQEHGQWNVVWN